MKTNKNKHNEKESIDYESSLRYLIEISNRRAWLVAFVSLIITFFSLGAIFFLTPLKEVKPYVIEVEQKTGMVNILTKLDKKTIPTQDALDKYWTNKYVKARESYYYDILNQDYTIVQLMSSERVAQQYRKLYEGDNSLVKKYKNDFETKIKVLSIVLVDSAGSKTATIRIIKTTENLKQKSIVERANKVITLTYKYIGDAYASEKDRIENPLGYKVETYRTDDEVK